MARAVKEAKVAELTQRVDRANRVIGHLIDDAIDQHVM